MILALLAWNGAASATLLSTTIFFSIDSSSDPGDPPPASSLDASITYTFDVATNKLKIYFDNMSSGLLTQLYFTTSSDVPGFEIIGVDFAALTDVTIGLNPNNPIDGMGSYQWLLDLGPGGAGIDDFGPGIDGTITLRVVGSGLDFNLSDFFILNGYGPAVLKFQYLDEFTGAFEEFNIAF